MGSVALLKNGDVIDIDAKKGSINVRLTNAQLKARRKNGKKKKLSFGSGTIWKICSNCRNSYLALQHIQVRKKKLKNIRKFNEKYVQ